MLLLNAQRRATFDTACIQTSASTKCRFGAQVMCPLWMVPIATGAGNTFLLKPSEKDAGAAVILAELAEQADDVRLQ